jgi:hypothetical protein
MVNYGRVGKYNMRKSKRYYYLPSTAGAKGERVWISFIHRSDIISPMQRALHFFFFFFCFSHLLNAACKIDAPETDPRSAWGCGMESEGRAHKRKAALAIFFFFAREHAKTAKRAHAGQ